MGVTSQQREGEDGGRRVCLRLETGRASKVGKALVLRDLTDVTVQIMVSYVN